MHRPLLPALFFLITATAQAQVLDQGSVPLIGDAWTYTSCSPITIEGTGAGQLWDASGATANGNPEGVQCVDPLNTTAGESFLEADIALNYAGTTTYQRSDEDGLYMIGSYVSNPGITSIYTDPAQQLVFPASLGTTWTDDFAGSYTYNNQVVEQSGQWTCDVSGAGDLTLPWGTVENVVRIDATETYTEVGLGNTFVMQRTLTEFYRPGLRTYLARRYSTTTTMNGAPAGSVQGFLYLDQDAFTGMFDHGQRSIGLEVFPNPAQDRTAVVFTASGSTLLTLYDAAGRSVQQLTPSAVDGLTKVTLDLNGLPAGLYSVRVQDRRGASGSARLMLTR